MDPFSSIRITKPGPSRPYNSTKDEDENDPFAAIKITKPAPATGRRPAPTLPGMDRIGLPQGPSDGVNPFEPVRPARVPGVGPRMQQELPEVATTAPAPSPIERALAQVAIQGTRKTDIFGAKELTPAQQQQAQRARVARQMADVSGEFGVQTAGGALDAVLNAVQGVGELADIALPGDPGIGEALGRSRAFVSERLVGQPETMAGMAGRGVGYLGGTLATYLMPAAAAARAAGAAGGTSRALNFLANPIGRSGLTVGGNVNRAGQLASGALMTAPVNVAMGLSPDNTAEGFVQLGQMMEGKEGRLAHAAQALGAAAEPFAKSPAGRVAFEFLADFAPNAAILGATGALARTREGLTYMQAARAARAGDVGQTIKLTRELQQMQEAGSLPLFTGRGAEPATEMPAIPSRPTQETIDRAAFTSKLNRALEAGNDAEIARLLERQQQLRPLDEQLADAIDRRTNARGKAAQKRAEAEVKRVQSLIEQQERPVQGPQQWRGPQRFAEDPTQMTLGEELAGIGRQTESLLNAPGVRAALTRGAAGAAIGATISEEDRNKVASGIGLGLLGAVGPRRLLQGVESLRPGELAQETRAIGGEAGLALSGGLAGGTQGETEEERISNAMLMAGMLGLPGVVRRSVPAITQEVRSVGRFGFVKPPETYVLNEALEREHVGNVLARTERSLSSIGARTEETANGVGLFGGEVSPNSILRFAEDATDDDIRLSAAMRGLAFGQDQQLWYRKARPNDPSGTAGIVITGPDFAELPDEAINAIVTRLQAEDALGPYGGATRDGNHLLALNLKRYTQMEDDAFQQAVNRAIADVSQSYDIDIHPSFYYAEHLDGNADYARAIGRRPDALRAARAALMDAQPEYLRYAEAVGADVPAVEREIADRIGSIDRLVRQIEQPPPAGNTKDVVPVAQAAKQVYTKFTPLVAESDEVIVPEMTSRLNAMVDDMVSKNIIPREMAQDFYRGATIDQRQIARLVLPELREDPKYTLYTVVNSILSSGQQVPVETRQGLNVFEQYLQTSKRDDSGRLIPGRFSILNPTGAQYKQAVTGGKKAFTGERGTGFLGERMAASPRTLNHEQALARLDALVQSLGEEGAIEAMLGTVPIMSGKTVKEEQPALIFLFGPKIGQYAMDKLGIPGGGKSTIDLWMARLDYALRGDTGAIQGDKLNDAVSPGMRRRMQAVLAQYAADNNMPESSAQALAWYTIKNAFREARAKEKAQAYATLGSASTEAIMTPLTREFGPEPIAQGLVKRPGSYEQAVEGWNDPTLRDFAKKTGREGKIAPTAGALAGKVFDIGGALGEGTSALMQTAGGRRLLGNVALGTTGYGLQGADDEKLRDTGKGMMALALGSAVYPALKAGVRQGARGIAEQLKQTPRGRYALNLLTRDITTDPAVKQAVEDALAERAQITARFQELAREARALGPTGDRVLSDLVESEGFAAQELAQMSPDDVATATAVAQRIANQVRELGSRKVEEELISQQTFLKRAESYLPRLYAKYDADGLVEDVAVTHKGKTFRITGEKIRNDNLTPEERDALGEIREASYRLAEAGRRGAQDVSTARLFRTLADMPGVIHPDFKAAKENELMAQLFAKQALKTGDRSAAREALQAAREARAEAKQLAEAYTQPNYAAQWLKKASEGTEYVRLPDTPNMGSLRGAVVRADVADYLHDLPDLASAPGMYRRLLRNWKEIKTVYNVGTQIANVLSNFSVVHAAGIPWWRQAAKFRGAAQDLKNYGPATKALTEAGVMGVNMPGFSDVPVKGVAQDVSALRQLAETTRPETRAALEEQGVTPYGRLGKLAKKGQIKAEQYYAAGDGIFRVMLYKKYVKDGMTSDEAIAEVMRNMPSYDTRSPILGALRMGPAPFIMYPVKYLPTVLDNIMMHPYRWATLAGTTWAVMDQASRRLYGEIEEQDLPPNRRSSSTFGYLLPGVTQTDFPVRPVMQRLGLTPSEDRKYTIDAARFTPLSAMTGTPVPGSDLSSQLLGDRAPQILQPSGPLMDVAALAMGKNAYTGEDFFSPSDEPLDKALKLGGWAYRMATPTFLGVHTPRVIGDIRRGDLDAAFTNALGILGMRPTMVTPGMQSQLQQRRFEEQMSDARLKLRQELRKARTPEEEARIEQKYEAKMNRLAAKYQQRLDEEEE